MYNAKTYWNNREKPNKYDTLKWWDVDILLPLVNKSNTILDYGCGDGRVFPLYCGKTVYGFDITDRHEKKLMAMAKKYNVDFTLYVDEETPDADLGVLNKVLLHSMVPKAIIDHVKYKCNTVFISSGVNLDAAHCFNHDYAKLLGCVKQFTQKGDDIAIVI